MAKSVKRSTTIRLSDQGREIQRALADKLGITLSAVLEQALRKMAEIENIQIGTKAGGNVKAK